MTAAARMASAATTFLESLDGRQRDLASLPFADHAERSTWYYFPNDQAGLPLSAMNNWQQKLAHRLLLSGLSLQAYSRACLVMTLDNTLDVLENFADSDFRDTSRYYVSIFGDPAGDAPWGWRFQGHHISVNYSVAGGEVAASTPLFLGANPARLQHNGRDYSRPFADAEELARELLHALSGELRAKAIVSERSPTDFVLANLPHPDSPPLASGRFHLPAKATFRGLMNEVGPNDRAIREKLAYRADAPLGVSGGSLSDGQRELLAGLVAHYADRFPEGVAWQGLSEIDDLHFAWAGGTAEGDRHYYRLQGPALLVEYDNTQDNGNHVHTVCRHPKNDFAADLLGLHHLWEHSTAK